MNFPPPNEFSLPFIRKVQLAKDAYSFFFDRTKFDFDFYPGQYVRLTIPHENKDERGEGRFFSIASSPLEKKEAMITTRIVQSSFKNALNTLKVGQDVQFFGPIGRFIFNLEEKDIPHVFFAGGIGITPFLSMIEYVYAQKLNTQLTLFASFTTPEDFVFYKELSQISQSNPNIKIIYTVTHPELAKGIWDGEVGRLSDSMIKKYVPDLANCISMTCGSASMLETMLKLITDMGVSPQNNRKEVFTGY